MRRFFLLVACAMEAVALNVFTLAQMGAMLYVANDPRAAARNSRGLLFFFLAACVISIALSFGTPFFTDPSWGFTNKPFLKPILRTGQIAISVLLFGALISENRDCDFEEAKRRFTIFFTILLAFNVFLFLFYEATGWTFLLQRFEIGGEELLTTRFRGLMYEGGPFGVMIALFCILNIEFRGFFRFGNLVAVALVIACTSKAALIVFLAYGFLKTCLMAYSRSKWLLFAYISGILLCMGTALKIVSQMDYFVAINLLSTGDATLNSFVFGRVPAVFIIPKMLLHSPLLGIGVGNYSLLRNDPNFRGFLPAVSVPEYHDWGGIIDLLVETGFLGIVAFFYLLYRMIKSLGIAKPGFTILLFIIPWLALDPVYQVNDWIYAAYLLILMSGRERERAAMAPPIEGVARPALVQ